jgi:hypothetical protein
VVFVEEEPHLARVDDLSMAGVGLVLDHPLGEGVEVALKMHNRQSGFGCLRVAKIAHATARPEGGYLVGFRFVNPLSEGQVMALVG